MREQLVPQHLGARPQVPTGPRVPRRQLMHELVGCTRHDDVVEAHRTPTTHTGKRHCVVNSLASAMDLPAETADRLKAACDEGKSEAEKGMVTLGAFQRIVEQQGLLPHLRFRRRVLTPEQIARRSSGKYLVVVVYEEDAERRGHCYSVCCSSARCADPRPMGYDQSFKRSAKELADMLEVRTRTKCLTLEARGIC